MKTSFAVTPAGNCPVVEFIEAQDPVAKAALLNALKAFSEQFPTVETVDCKHLRDGMWEMRVRDQTGRQFRLLYAVGTGTLHVLHAFEKKSRKTPKKDLALGLKRLRFALPR